MHATVLAIFHDGRKALSVWPDDEKAWNVLMAFIDERWADRFGPVAAPHDQSERARLFFGDQGLYVIANVDLAALRDQFQEDLPRETWLEALRVP